MTAVALRRVASLITDCPDRGRRQFVALENVESGTGRLADGELAERDVPEAGAAAVEPGFVLFGKLRPYLAKTWLADRPVYASTEFLALRPGGGIDGRWLAYLCSSRPLIEWSVATSDGTKMPRTSWEKLSAFRLQAPALKTQREIADFLDAETARIDALIEKKRRIIDLLETRWETSARDRFANLGPRMPLKRRWRVIDCKHRTPVYVDEGYPVASPGDLSPGRVDLSRCHRFVGDVDFADLTEGRGPRRGDIIYSRNASAGIAAYVDTDQPFCMGQDVCLITSPDEDQRFLMYALNTIGADQLAPIKIGSTITRINVDQVGELEIPAPTAERQRQIADALDHERGLIDRLVRRIRHQIALLTEHRQALITAAVTGQLEIASRA